MTWETVETWDFGFDFGAFNNRLTGTLIGIVVLQKT